MNGIKRTCSLSIGLITICFVFTATSYADEPSIAIVKQAMPVLSPENEALNSFYFVGEFVIPFGVPVAFEACWSRESGFGFAQVDHFGYPMFFIAEKKMLLYDASQSQVNLGKDVFPNVIVQQKNRKLTLKTGFNINGKATFLVDMPSLISTAKTEPEVSRVNETDWKLTYTFGKGDEVIYVFRVDREVSFKSALLKSGHQSIFTIRNVLINQPVPDRLMKFPETKSISSEVTVKELIGIPPTGVGETLEEGFEYSIFTARALYAPSAIHNAKYRRYPPFPANIEWKQVEKSHKRIGPKLRALLKVDFKGRVILLKQ